ncbi:MAG: hypothetical protein AVDCRST_MAG33-743 [uncultured Thermomicrobiales bacterium]|uniref:Uncharacterized protein n=1 Tax=uncultured Thermomicrobiales bacterium TaxID=1645740 RepID=A0A6J4UFR9_9BACT|nr:MAG: hypothetical protein AVDCRST_MAG33-743 [uncultured Thermomicrobiales bacterium]
MAPPSASPWAATRGPAAVWSVPDTGRQDRSTRGPVVATARGEAGAIDIDIGTGWEPVGKGGIGQNEPEYDGWVMVGPRQVFYAA